MSTWLLNAPICNSLVNSLQCTDINMTHLKVELAFLSLICWRVWQQVQLAFGKANKCASMTPQYVPQPKFEIFMRFSTVVQSWEESHIRCRTRAINHRGFLCKNYHFGLEISIKTVFSLKPQGVATKQERWLKARLRYISADSQKVWHTGFLDHQNLSDSRYKWLKQFRICIIQPNNQLQNLKYCHQMKQRYFMDYFECHEENIEGAAVVKFQNKV